MINRKTKNRIGASSYLYGQENINEYTRKRNKKADYEYTEGNVKEDLSNLKAQISNLKKDISGVDGKINASVIKMVEILGIFVALFTFVSVDINIFKNDAPPDYGQIVGLTLILLAALAFFCYILHTSMQYFVSRGSKKSFKHHFGWAAIIIVIFFIGIHLVADQNQQAVFKDQGSNFSIGYPQ